MAKKSIYEKVRRESGRPRNFDFSLRELKPYTDKYGDVQVVATYEVRIAGVSDEYNTITDEPMLEPYHGRHLHYFNNDWDLENDVEMAIQEHLWDFVGEYTDGATDDKKVYEQLIKDVGNKVRVLTMDSKEADIDDEIDDYEVSAMTRRGFLQTLLSPFGVSLSK